MKFWLPSVLLMNGCQGARLVSVNAPLKPPNEILRTRLLDTLTRTLERLISPQSLEPQQEQEDWFLYTASELANDADGHILGATTAMFMAANTGRLDVSIAGLFGAGKSRDAAVEPQYA